MNNSNLVQSNESMLKEQYEINKANTILKKTIVKSNNKIFQIMQHTSVPIYNENNIKLPLNVYFNENYISQKIFNQEHRCSKITKKQKEKRKIFQIKLIKNLINSIQLVNRIKYHPKYQKMMLKTYKKKILRLLNDLIITQKKKLLPKKFQKNNIIEIRNNIFKLKNINKQVHINITRKEYSQQYITLDKYLTKQYNLNIIKEYKIKRCKLTGEIKINP